MRKGSLDEEVEKLVEFYKNYGGKPTDIDWKQLVLWMGRPANNSQNKSITQCEDNFRHKPI